MLFFYHGENSWLAKQKIEAIIKKFKAQVDPAGQNIEYLDGETLSLDNFFRSVSVIGFLAAKKLIIIKNIFDNKKLSDLQGPLIDFIKKQKDTPEENYIIFWQSGRPDSRTKLYKALSKLKFSEEFKNLNNTQLIAWIKKQASKLGRDISNEATSLLINYIGNDLWQLDHEISKLAHFSKDKIEEDDVKNLVQAKTDENIFTLIDALGKKDKALALKLLEEKLHHGINHQYILTMIVRQFRMIIKAKSLADNINGPGHLSQLLKIHPLVAEKTLSQSKMYKIEELKKIYNELLHLDEKFKTSQNQEKILFAKMINDL